MVFFKTMLKTENPVGTDEHGCVFIDRDPMHFRLILNYMRDGNVALPESEQHVRDVLKEAEYYCMEGLMQLCQHRLRETGLEIRVINSVQELFMITSTAVKPIVVIHCRLYSISIRYPTNFTVRGFIEKYQDKWDIYFYQQNSSRKNCTFSLYKEGHSDFQGNYTSEYHNTTEEYDNEFLDFLEASMENFLAL